MSNLRALPSVEQLLQMGAAVDLSRQYGRPLLLEAIRGVLADARAAADRQEIPDRDNLIAQAGERLRTWLQPTLVGVINASGVVLHTNLGRAPLSTATIDAMRAVSQGYSTLEYDLSSGARGSRTVHAEGLLRRLTGAEAALVVNNNAAAVLLVLSALARRQRVIISRTQLVEIGGGFRVPEVMSQSGAKLIEVGTTNRVNLKDYEAALAEAAGLVFHAHSSNFRIIGFTAEPTLNEIATTAHSHNAILVDDLGSGALLDTARFGLAHEPTVQESLAAGCDLVCFSGDKLLGGPQAGIVIGKAEWIKRIKKHPLARAVRADKICLAGIAATLTHYLKDEAVREIPIWRMISTPLERLQERAAGWCSDLNVGTVVAGLSTVGGGSLPEESLPAALLALDVPQPNRFLARLRQTQPAIIARVENERVVFDPRTVLPEQDVALLDGIRTALSMTGGKQRGRNKNAI